jgi:hypothetical protein
MKKCSVKKDEGIPEKNQISEDYREKSMKMN